VCTDAEDQAQFEREDTDENQFHQDYTNKSDPYVQRTIADTRARWNPINEALDSWLQNPLRREVKAD